MSDKTILVIDDSSTIRKLVDTHLSPHGYHVVLAASAEEGLQMAGEVGPELILLDHQLPGTTGYEVARQLAEDPDLRGVPVVISSTLRKKAYAEYIDLDNVVDMLPKPYTEELLRTTVENALETAAMIVASQSGGTAVPEVIDIPDESALAGSLACFGLRELLDFLNNGRKVGVLEVQAERMRIRFHLEKGRIQAVYAAGLDPAQLDEITERLPKSLATLAPILKMTISGRSCAEVDGFVQLLDQKVLDPRLMTRLLRFQAAMLMRIAFTAPLSEFRFESGHVEHALHKNLPLDISLLALLVEGAIHGEDTSAGSEEGQASTDDSYVRRAVRGQNLDRAGLAARHMKLFSELAQPRSVAELAAKLGWEHDEVAQVLSGFVMAELVERRAQSVAGQFVVFEPDADQAALIRQSLESSDDRYSGKIVRDKLALQLVLKRSIPHTLIFAADNKDACGFVKQLFATKNPQAAKVKRVAILPTDYDPQEVDWIARVGFYPGETIHRPCDAESLFGAFDRLFSAPETQQAAAASQPDEAQPAETPETPSEVEPQYAGAEV